MREELLAVEQLRKGLSCKQRWEWVVRGRIYGAWVRAADFGVLLNNLSQTRDMKALVIGTQVIDSQRGLRVIRQRLDVRGSQTWRRAVKFKRGGGGAATLRPSIPSIHLSGEKIFTLPT